ncbi:hypothetical protein Hypma_006703 [Hypsizygus marmoreus]|uniref:NADH dehydrogenase [ubiquinone] 1 beta subcomplex subunit 8, mitochondrial n=1 Tax=Hypsizygus marmoreus TaxID=39966 RepID=A0A369K5V4_HYPMA|nr:hypothetical protein Hypma_006703 [Hypsizygus marmoreus]
MTTTVALRRVAAASSAATRPIVLSAGRKSHTRNYATSTKEEVDPQLNGYPQLPFVSRQELPALGWQDPLLRRNFGDTLHEQDELLSMWGPDIPPVSPQSATIQFLIAVSGFVGFGFLVKNVLAQDPPAVRREYPFDGLVKELGGLEANKARAESLEED